MDPLFFAEILLGNQLHDTELSISASGNTEPDSYVDQSENSGVQLLGEKKCKSRISKIDKFGARTGGELGMG